ncbi:Triacylglycerol lipase [Nocardioides aquaticus]|uniref:Triacylglycerol lipase n=1 Tax=Nocardioides aquaticus TaxID=160826 RepID=A0ABX8ELD2_9ACTN|nr:alpha/beta fold hydrolase [Nocardioides aquaticus]QVT81306.1 Triacylglycerol lipase [Nocardioides aquaticus]
MTGVSPTASFLLPEGFAPPGAAAVLREAGVVGEAGRALWHAAGEHRRRRALPYAERSRPRDAEPVVLVPGFLAGDGSLTVLAAGLRRAGRRTYRAQIHANIGCTASAADQLESRIESVAARRGSRVQVVGHSLGGMLARGLAVRRPDLISGIVTLGSPMLAPGAHHVSLSASLELLVRLSAAGWRGLMAEDCVNGRCARASFNETRAPVPDEVSFTAVWSRRDGVVDHRACVDPEATSVEVRATHLGMALDPQVLAVVVEALGRHDLPEVGTTTARAAARLTGPRGGVGVGVGSAVEVDRGESA